MSEAAPGIEAIELETNGMIFSGLAAGPPSGELVLLLHGWPQFADSWTEVASLLGAAGYRAVALDQRGYSTGARPEAQDAYGLEHLVSDVVGFADALGHRQFHIVAHDWGAIVAWHVAEKYPDRVLTFTSLAIPHIRALVEAKNTDPDQKQRGAYVDFFRASGNVAEKALLGSDAAALRAIYEGKLSPAQVDENVRRFQEAGAMTAVLNYYRAFDWNSLLGNVSVPTLHVWASNDRALGEVSARNTAQYMTGPYKLEIVPTTHWIADEIPNDVVAMVLPHLAAHARAMS